MDSQITLATLIEELLGGYISSQGGGISALDWPWLVGACFFLLSVWFLYRLILSLVRK